MYMVFLYAIVSTFACAFDQGQPVWFLSSRIPGGLHIVYVNDSKLMYIIRSLLESMDPRG